MTIILDTADAKKNRTPFPRLLDRVTKEEERCCCHWLAGCWLFWGGNLMSTHVNEKKEPPKRGPSRQRKKSRGRPRGKENQVKENGRAEPACASSTRRPTPPSPTRHISTCLCFQRSMFSFFVPPPTANPIKNKATMKRRWLQPGTTQPVKFGNIRPSWRQGTVTPCQSSFGSPDSYFMTSISTHTHRGRGGAPVKPVRRARLNFTTLSGSRSPERNAEKKTPKLVASDSISEFHY